MDKLFDSICDIVFTLNDGSQLKCKTTLSPQILESYGYADVDDFIDLSSGRIIPEDMFNYSFEIFEENSGRISKLDELFEIGGKVHWSITT